MSKHTPGPWFIYDENHECPGIEANGVTIVVFGKTLCENELRGVQGNTVEECKANANLIAAAPELLEALQELMEVAERCDGWQSFPSNPIEKAQAAISKATGGAK